MSIGSWDPQAEQSSKHYQIELALLQRFIQISADGQLDNIARLLSPEEQQHHAAIMQTDQQAWDVADGLDDNDIEQLMRFFTVAEQLPGWEAADHSPVIWLGKILKQRGTGINRELVLWIKAHSDNKYLPNGPLL